MHDEPNSEEKRSELEAGNRSPTQDDRLENSAVFEARLAELENSLEQRKGELARADARLIELAQVLSNKDSELATLRQAEAGLREKLTALSDSLAGAVANYKAVVLQSNPEVVEELISGDSIESINDSLSKAKSLVNKVRLGVEAEILSVRVPAGAPERTSPNLSPLSPREKIKQALGGLSH